MRNIFNDFRFTFIMDGALYMDDSYLKEFEAVIEAVKDDKFIVLNHTAFYPNGGGQLFDTGFIKNESGEEFKVVFVGKFDGKISHEVDKPGLKVGDAVQCILDWNKRYSYMRHHTAAHIVSAVLHREAGAKITGNQINEDKLRIDFDLDNFDRDIIQKYIDIANMEIAKNQDVKTYYLSRNDAMKIPGVVKLAGALPPSIDTLRIVEIGDVDLQADGGTHVKNTSEIGVLSILKAENKGKSNRRIYLILNK